MWWIATAGAGGLVGWCVGLIMGIQRGRGMRGRMLRRRPREEVAIEEAKLLYEFGTITRAELETRIGHLVEWDGEP